MIRPDPYRAAREGAALVDRSDRGRLWLAGPDRATYLQGLLTNDVKALPAGAGCYAAWLTAQGRMVSDVRVYELGDGMLLTLPGPRASLVRDRLEQLIFAEQVSVEDRTRSWSQVGVHGPHAAGALTVALGAVGVDLPAAERVAGFEGLRCERLMGGAGELIVVGTDELGGGLDVVAEAGLGAAVRSGLEAAGAVALPAAVVEALRVEAGLPEFGVDMDEDTIPLEAGLESRAISFTKGCYVGQEVIVRVRDRGHGRVARRLVGLVLEGRDTTVVPARGAALRAGDRDVGRVTSAVWSPALGQAIALGYVHRDFTEPGTTVTVATDRGAVDARIRALPFIQRHSL